MGVLRKARLSRGAQADSTVLAKNRIELSVYSLYIVLNWPSALMAKSIRDGIKERNRVLQNTEIAHRRTRLQILAQENVVARCRLISGRYDIANKWGAFGGLQGHAKKGRKQLCRASALVDPRNRWRRPNSRFPGILSVRKGSHGVTKSKSQLGNCTDDGWSVGVG